MPAQAEGERDAQVIIQQMQIECDRRKIKIAEMANVQVLESEGKLRAASNHAAALIAQDYPTAAEVYVASGQEWPDALAGAAAAGAQDAPLLLVRQGSVPPATWTALERLQPGLISVLGGEMAVADTVLEELRTLE